MAVQWDFLRCGQSVSTLSPKTGEKSAERDRRREENFGGTEEKSRPFSRTKEPAFPFGFSKEENIFRRRGNQLCGKIFQEIERMFTIDCTKFRGICQGVSGKFSAQMF